MARKATKKPAVSKTQPKELPKLSDERFQEMVSQGQELALLDVTQNLRVRAQKHLIPSRVSQTR